MINSLGNDFLFFYQLYEQYNKENKCVLLSLKDNEKYNFVLIVINYRNFINIFSTSNEGVSKSILHNSV